MDKQGLELEAVKANHAKLSADGKQQEHSILNAYDRLQYDIIACYNMTVYHVILCYTELFIVYECIVITLYIYIYI